MRLFLVTLLISCCITSVHAKSPRWLWVYAKCNFQVDKSTDKLIALMERAKKAGYNGVHVNDFHATLLRLFGFDHKKLTYRFKGRDFRLTDVGGRVITDLIA